MHDVKKPHINSVLHYINKYIQFECYVKYTDDLYYENIDNYHEYLSNMLSDIKAYFLKDVEPYLTLEYVELEDCPILESPYDFKDFEYLPNVALNKLYTEMLCLIDESLSFLSKVKEVNKEELIDTLSKVVKLTEKYTYYYIDKREIYKNTFTKEQYEIFEKYNCLNKITYLLKMPQLFGFDYTDFKSFLEDAKIQLIVDGDKEFIFGNEQSDGAVFITKADTFFELEENYQKYVKKYNLNISDKILSIDYNIKGDFLLLFKCKKI